MDRAAKTKDTDERDATVRDVVIEALFRRGYPALWQVQVSVCRSRVNLTGRVPSYYLRQIAQSAAMSVSGVDRVDVAFDGAERCDAEIKAILALTKSPQGELP